MRNLICKRVPVDEIWSFCYTKAKNTPKEPRHLMGVGDAYTWVAIDADTKLVPSWLVGKRDAETFQSLDCDACVMAPCELGASKPKESRMSSTVEMLEAEALQLSSGERARLVDRLIASLDVDPALEDAWAAEVERRNAQIESGAVTLLPGAVTLAKLKAGFR